MLASKLQHKATSASPQSTLPFSSHDNNTMANHRADEKRFLDERGSGGPLAPNGLNPATIMEKPVRERIVDCYFWKAQCFALNEATLIDRVVSDVHFIGGTYGDAQRPSPFLCLAFKLLQLGPSDEILREYLDYGGEKFKYLRALACFYIRLTRSAKDVYVLLEEHLGDYRKLKRKGRQGTSLTYMDEFIDDLLVKERVCGTTLWKMPKRELLEDLDELEPRISKLGDIEDLLESEPEEVDGEINGREEGEDSESEERRRKSPGDEFGEESPDREDDEMDIDGAPNGKES